MKLDKNLEIWAKAMALSSGVPTGFFKLKKKFYYITSLAIEDETSIYQLPVIDLEEKVHIFHPNLLDRLKADLEESYDFVDYRVLVKDKK